MKTPKLKSNHNFMKTKFITCLLIIHSIICVAQEMNRPMGAANFIAPNANALYQYTTIPVSLYNGVPQIEVPLYTITDKSISLPISLSYHSSGIKVDECATKQWCSYRRTR